jgi:hypothetical protein
MNVAAAQVALCLVSAQRPRPTLKTISMLIRSLVGLDDNITISANTSLGADLIHYVMGVIARVATARAPCGASHCSISFRNCYAKVLQSEFALSLSMILARLSVRYR